MTIQSQNLTNISEFHYALHLLPSNFMSMLPVSLVFTNTSCWLLVLDTSSTNQIVKQIISLLYNNQIVKQIIILVCNIKTIWFLLRSDWCCLYQVSGVCIRGAGQGPCASAIISILKNCTQYGAQQQMECGKCRIVTALTLKFAMAGHSTTNCSFYMLPRVHMCACLLLKQ